jgi:hypothetical protein
MHCLFLQHVLTRQERVFYGGAQFASYGCLQFALELAFVIGCFYLNMLWWLLKAEGDF